MGTCKIIPWKNILLTPIALKQLSCKEKTSPIGLKSF